MILPATCSICYHNIIFNLLFCFFTSLVELPPFRFQTTTIQHHKCDVICAEPDRCARSHSGNPTAAGSHRDPSRGQPSSHRRLAEGRPANPSETQVPDVLQPGGLYPAHQQCFPARWRQVHLRCPESQRRNQH